MDIGNMDASYDAFSYVVSLCAVNDITAHNYVLLRNDEAPNVSFGVMSWDSDLALGAPTKAPVCDYNILGSLGSVFMANRLLAPKDAELAVDTFHTIKSSHDIFDPISAPADLDGYLANFSNVLMHGALSVENIERHIDDYSAELAEAIARDDAKWSGYYCPGDNLFSFDTLKGTLRERHEAMLAKIAGGVDAPTANPYKYCNYVAAPDAFVLSVGALASEINLSCRNKEG
jgi:hypothetical protein